MLMDKLRGLVCLENPIIIQMLQRKDEPDGRADEGVAKKNDAHLWNMNAIELIGLAVTLDVPILSKVEEIGSLSADKNHFSLVRADGGVNY